MAKDPDVNLYSDADLPQSWDSNTRYVFHYAPTLPFPRVPLPPVDGRPYEDTPCRDLTAAWRDLAAQEDWYGLEEEFVYALIDELGHVRAERDLSRTRFSELSATHTALEDYATELARELEGCRAHIGRLLSQQVDDLDPLRPFRPGLSPFDSLLE